MNWNFLMSEKRGTKGNNGQRKRIYICEIRNGYYFFTVVNIVSLITKHVCLRQIHHPSKPI